MNKKINRALLLGFGTLLVLISLTAGAQAQHFAGEWDTVTGSGRKISLRLVGRGTDVSGTFLPPNALARSNQPSDDADGRFVKVSAFTVEPAMQNAGSITGTVEGNVLRFTWAQDSGRGAGRFVLSADGESFQGTYSRTNNPDDTSGGTWNGTRRHSFAGAWRGTYAGGALETILQQSGDQVTGVIKVNSAELGIIRSGAVVGRTLRFSLVRIVFVGSRGREEYVGQGELVLGANARSFSGTILGTAASANLVGR